MLSGDHPAVKLAISLMVIYAVLVVAAGLVAPFVLLAWLLLR